MSKISICPKCGQEYSERPALSRVDGKMDICPDCGMREALDAWKQIVLAKEGDKEDGERKAQRKRL